MTVETIPLPEDRIANEESFEVRATDLYAWPEQEIIVAFEHNEQTDRWIWECRHSRFGRLWPRGVATLEYEYSFTPYFGAKFTDTAGRHSQVTTDNLGADVVLAVYPGPRGGSFHPDAELSQEEEDRILGRRAVR